MITQNLKITQNGKTTQTEGVRAAGKGKATKMYKKRKTRLGAGLEEGNRVKSLQATPLNTVFRA